MEKIYSKESLDLLAKLLKIEIKERISWNDFFNHPYITQPLPLHQLHHFSLDVHAPVKKNPSEPFLSPHHRDLPFIVNIPPFKTVNPFKVKILFFYLFLLFLFIFIYFYLFLFIFIYFYLFLFIFIFLFELKIFFHFLTKFKKKQKIN